MTLSLSLLTGVPDPSPGYSGDHDFGTPAPDRRLREPAPATIDITIDGQTIMVPVGTSVMRAAGGRRRPQVMRHRRPRRVRVVPALPGRDRWTQGCPGLCTTRQRRE